MYYSIPIPMNLERKKRGPELQQSPSIKNVNSYSRLPSHENPGAVRHQLTHFARMPRPAFSVNKPRRLPSVGMVPQGMRPGSAFKVGVQRSPVYEPHVKSVFEVGEKSFFWLFPLFISCSSATVSRFSQSRICFAAKNVGLLFFVLAQSDV